MAKNKPLKTSDPEAKEYPHPELYKGYYWLILDVDPNVLIDSIGTRVPKIIPENKFKYPMPDCVKSAIRAKTVIQTISKEEVDRCNEGLTPGHPFYASSEPYPTYEIDDIFGWLLQDKNVPTLRLADGKEIRIWRDIRELWEEADIPFQDLRESGPVPYEEQYSEEHFYRLEHHLAKQHQENLEELKPPGAWGKVKEFFKKHWLVFTIIIGAISAIISIITQIPKIIEWIPK